MPIGEKIKHALHLDKGSTGTGHTESTHASEPQTGPEAYQPLTHSAGAAEGGSVGKGAASSKHSGASGAGAHSGSAGGDGRRSASSQGGQVPSETSTGATQDDPISRFSKGYDESTAAPGYHKGYKAGEPIYHEKVTDKDDGSWSAELQASSENKHWKEARELTLAAEREAAAANLSGGKANKELVATEKAEEAVRKAQQKYREALAEAERQRDVMKDPSLHERGLADAQDLYQKKRSAAEEAERALREFEADLAGKKKDLDALHPKVERYGQTLPGLEQDYAARQKEREGAEKDKDSLLLAAKDVEGARTRAATDLEALEAEMEAAERTAAAKQQEYINARNRAQGLGQELDKLRNKLRSLDDDLLGRRGQAQEAEENLPAYREAEQRALRELENAKAEWYRLKELEDEYASKFEDANGRLQGLRGKYDPASKELRDADSRLKARQDDLERARARAVQAEGKYKELLSLADRHKHYGDSAATAAETHGQKFVDAKKEANMHGDKHVELWQKAKTEGESGSTEATSAIKKLEEKVKSLVGKHDHATRAEP